MPKLPVDDLNAATPIAALALDRVPTESFYTRSNFGVPRIEPGAWSLEVTGAVDRPFAIDLAGLGDFEVVEERITLECAGNFRTLMDPAPRGTPWGIGAAASADFRGVRLADVLLRSHPDDDAVEWVFEGSDRGHVGSMGEIAYAFPLEVGIAHGPGPLLVWEMNGEPLPAVHGGPVRVVVPGHYGMRSVKWVRRAEAVRVPFTGHFREKYRYYGSATEPDGAPVDLIRVRSMIVEPGTGRVASGPVAITGVAWSGQGRIVRVEVRVDDGDWVDAGVGDQPAAHAMARWSATIDLPPGDHRITARATDEAGDAQPETPRWNRNGYGNNVVHSVVVSAT